MKMVSGKKRGRTVRPSPWKPKQRVSLFLLAASSDFGGLAFDFHHLAACGIRSRTGGLACAFLFPFLMVGACAVFAALVFDGLSTTGLADRGFLGLHFGHFLIGGLWDI